MTDCLYAFYPVVSLAINVTSHILSFRCIFKPNLLKSIFFGFLCGAAGLLFISISRGPSYTIINLIIYLALSNGYFHFVNMGQTARRIRILREMAASKDGLTLDGILRRYNTEEIIDRRLDRLIATGQILIRDGRYYININKPVMLLIARFITALKILILGKKREMA